MIKDLKKVSKKNIGKFKNCATSININELTFIALSKIKQLSHIPKIGESIRIITIKHITTFDFILSIVKNEIIETLTMATYSIGLKNIDLIKELKNNNSISGDIIILTNSNIKKFNPNLWRNLQLLKAEIKLADNHSKVILIKTKKNYYCIEGSGNLNHNARIEQYVFSNNKEIYNFHYKWIKNI